MIFPVQNTAHWEGLRGFIRTEPKKQNEKNVVFGQVQMDVIIYRNACTCRTKTNFSWDQRQNINPAVASLLQPKVSKEKNFKDKASLKLITYNPLHVHHVQQPFWFHDLFLLCHAFDNTQKIWRTIIYHLHNLHIFYQGWVAILPKLTDDQDRGRFQCANGRYSFM